jgi:hypothetical protein
MKNSNKVLLIAVAVLLALILSFVLVMGLTTRDLFERHGRTVQATGFPAERPEGVYRFAASSTMALSFSSTALFGNCDSASSSTARACS